MVVKPFRSGVPEIVVTLDVAGTEAGKAVEASLLRVSDGVRDSYGRRLK